MSSCEEPTLQTFVQLIPTLINMRMGLCQTLCANRYQSFLNVDVKLFLHYAALEDSMFNFYARNSFAVNNFFANGRGDLAAMFFPLLEENRNLFRISKFDANKILFWYQFCLHRYLWSDGGYRLLRSDGERSLVKGSKSHAKTTCALSLKRLEESINPNDPSGSNARYDELMLAYLNGHLQDSHTDVTGAFAAALIYFNVTKNTSKLEKMNLNMAPFLPRHIVPDAQLVEKIFSCHKMWKKVGSSATKLLICDLGNERMLSAPNLIPLTFTLSLPAFCLYFSTIRSNESIFKLWVTAFNSFNPISFDYSQDIQSINMSLNTLVSNNIAAFKYKLLARYGFHHYFEPTMLLGIATDRGMNLKKAIGQELTAEFQIISKYQNMAGILQTTRFPLVYNAATFDENEKIFLGNYISNFKNEMNAGIARVRETEFDQLMDLLKRIIE